MRAGIESALQASYAVNLLADTKNAIDEMRRQPPLALVVDDAVEPDGGMRFLRRVAEFNDLRAVPSLLLIAPEQERWVTKTDYLAGVAYLIKPIDAAALRKKVSDLVNAGVERSWNQLPKLQRTVLVETASIFKSCFHAVHTGEAVPLKKVEASCAPLIEAVKSNQINELLSAVQNHDDYSYVHSLRVAIYLSLLGNAIGVRDTDLMILTSGGLMHDLGKCMIPHEVLNKPGRLSEDEFTVMKSHVDHTRDIFDRTTGIGEGIQVIALDHHEKLDGSGYPHGKEGRDLNELARMATLVDIYSALTDRRVYKPPMEPEKAIAILEEMGRTVDQALLAKFKVHLLDSARGRKVA